MGYIRLCQSLSDKISKEKLMFEELNSKQKRYWPALITKIVGVALIIPLIIVTILMILIVLSLRGYFR